jgi:hypothetical protein
VIGFAVISLPLPRRRAWMEVFHRRRSVLVVVERDAVPDARLQVQYPSGLDGEVGSWMNIHD